MRRKRDVVKLVDRDVCAGFSARAICRPEIDARDHVIRLGAREFDLGKPMRVTLIFQLV